MLYTTIRAIHVTAVTISSSGFIARGWGVLGGRPWVRHRLARTLPHLVDTVLLSSAIAMLWSLRLSPWESPWLRAKIAGLLIYVALGSIALRPAAAGRTSRPKAVRAVAWALALLVFGYVVSVAITKDPRGALAWLTQSR